MDKPTMMIIAAVVLGGCAVDPLEDRNPLPPSKSTGANPEALRAWLWAYDARTDSLRVYHTIDKQCWESFHLDLNPGNGMYRGGLVGGGLYPTLWFRRSNTVTALTNGILDHGNHGHIVHPELHVEMSFDNGFSVTDMSVTPDGKRIVVCGAGRSWPPDSSVVTVIDYLTTETVYHRPRNRVTYVVAAEDRILFGNDQSRTAHIIGLENGPIISTISTDTLVTDGVYHAPTKTSFLAGRNGIDVVDMQSGRVVKAIAYNRNAFIARMLCAPGSDYALGLSDSGAGTVDYMTVIDMSNHTVNDYPIPGASLAPNLSDGTVALSGDGTVAVVSDMALRVLYRLSLDDGTIERAVAPNTACSVACNWDGKRVWALARDKGYQISYEKDAIVDSIALGPGINWIMVTSFRNNSALYDSNDHTF
ncbi:MAG: hypothetical protein GF344_08975 [Chitinivibrionales bacterium]|nr:hypothetical protein [Chitinivibrionales bacterium]MBD3356993.1 hypothetical protein [Chitinivibrionales bacterium]